MTPPGSDSDFFNASPHPLLLVWPEAPISSVDAAGFVFGDMDDGEAAALLQAVSRSFRSTARAALCSGLAM